MSQSREEIIARLHQVFGSEDFTKTLIGTVVEANNGNFEATLDELLNMTQDVTGRPAGQEVKVPVPALIVCLGCR